MSPFGDWDLGIEKKKNSPFKKHRKYQQGVSVNLSVLDLTGSRMSLQTDKPVGRGLRLCSHSYIPYVICIMYINKPNYKPTVLLSVASNFCSFPEGDRAVCHSRYIY